MEINVEQWERDGYYILPGFYSSAEIDTAAQAQVKVWEPANPRVVVDNLRTNERKLLADVTEEERAAHSFKVNDLYLEVHQVRHLALNKRMTPILETLLGDRPVLCNSLSFEFGSQQPDHVDSLYMTPQTDGHLIAIWVALEDCHPDAGPLRYYPGSNKIPAYIFSNGGRSAIPEEMDQWSAYIADNLTSRGLTPHHFPAKKGDVFIWSCNLLHGGSHIKDKDKTRRSLVFHYYSKTDVDTLDVTARIYGHGFYMYRPHQPINGVYGELPP